MARIELSGTDGDSTWTAVEAASADDLARAVALQPDRPLYARADPSDEVAAELLGTGGFTPFHDDVFVLPPTLDGN